MLAMVLTGVLLTSGECPEQARVDALVLTLTTAPQRAAVGGWVVRAEGAELVVSLRSSAGAVVQQRRLKAQGSCDARARTAAVVIATWVSEAPVVETKVEPAPPPPVSPAPPPLRAPLAVLREPDAPIPAAPPTRVGLELTAFAQLEGLTPGGGLRLDVGDTFGGFAEVTSGQAAVLPLGRGQVSWRRVPLGLGGRWRFMARPTTFAELDLSAQTALLALQASGFTEQKATQRLDIAGCTGLRAGVQPGAIGVVVGLRACFWAFDTTVAVEGVAERVTLPRAGLGLVVGVVWKAR